jgi:hypothetical protein
MVYANLGKPQRLLQLKEFSAASSAVTRARSARKMDPETEGRYKAFLKERRKILEDIKQFLNMVLTYFSFLETKWGGCESVVSAINIESMKSLIKSLCLIHGLYGYPADNDNTGKRTG